MATLINETINELLTWEEICQKYPNVWVMVGYPESEAKKYDWKQSKGLCFILKRKEPNLHPIQK